MTRPITLTLTLPDNEGTFDSMISVTSVRNGDPNGDVLASGSLAQIEISYGDEVGAKYVELSEGALRELVHHLQSILPFPAHGAGF